MYLELVNSQKTVDAWGTTLKRIFDVAVVTIQVFLTAKSCAGVLSKGRYGCSLSTI